MKLFTSADLAEYKLREFIEICGSWKSGKSYDVLSIAQSWQRIESEGTVYIIDTENQIRKMWKAQFRDVDNIKLYMCADMDDVILAIDTIKPKLHINDWICLESKARIWEFAQDLGYMAIAGMKKAEYLSKQRTDGGPITPHPDQLWSIVKNAYYRNMMDVLVNEVECNIVITTTMSKSVKDMPKRESPTRKAVRMMLGTDVSLDGDPRNPYYPDTIVMTTKGEDGFWATVLGDRGGEIPGQQIHFKVDSFLFDFMENCR